MLFILHLLVYFCKYLSAPIQHGLIDFGNRLLMRRERIVIEVMINPHEILFYIEDMYLVGRRMQSVYCWYCCDRSDHHQPNNPDRLQEVECDVQ